MEHALKLVADNLENMVDDPAPVHPQIEAIAADRAAELLAEAEAAHQAELAAEAAERDMRTAASEADRKAAERHADAIRVVMREKVRHGHDLTAIRPHESQAVEIIHHALKMVSAGDKPVQEDAFNAASDPADIAKGAAVGAVLNGGGNGSA